MASQAGNAATCRGLRRISPGRGNSERSEFAGATQLPVIIHSTADLRDRATINDVTACGGSTTAFLVVGSLSD
jgi:hypothetical protein